MSHGEDADNPFKPPRAKLWQELPGIPVNSYYRDASYFYALIAFLILLIVVMADNWSSLADLMLTVYLLLPCATSASLLWGKKSLQAVVMRIHLLALLLLLAYGVFLAITYGPPPWVVIVFAAWNVFILVWSFALFRGGSDNSPSPGGGRSSSAARLRG